MAAIVNSIMMSYANAKFWLKFAQSNFFGLKDFSWISSHLWCQTSKWAQLNNSIHKHFQHLLIPTFLLNRFLQNNTIQMVSSRAFSGLFTLEKLWVLHFSFLSLEIAFLRRLWIIFMFAVLQFQSSAFISICSFMKSQWKSVWCSDLKMRNDQSPFEYWTVCTLAQNCGMCSMM